MLETEDENTANAGRRIASSIVQWEQLPRVIKYF